MRGILPASVQAIPDDSLAEAVYGCPSPCVDPKGRSPAAAGPSSVSTARTPALSADFRRSMSSVCLKSTGIV